jgi:flagellar biosynthesis protein FlhG
LNKLRFVAASQVPEKSAATRIVSVFSGKGGVGKTVFACNLAERIGSLGYRVLLVDADFSFGNVHFLTNANGDYGVGMFASGRLSLKEASTRITDHLDILASESNHDTKQLCDAKLAAATMKKLRQQADEYDLILIDHASGKSDAATVMALASDLNVLVVVPELTSLADGYGLFKHLIQTDSRINCSLVINRAESSDEADYVRRKFAALSNRFLNRMVPCLGYLPEDRAVRESVSSQRLLADVRYDSEVLQSLTRIGSSVVQEFLSLTERSWVAGKIRINENQVVADIKE